MGLSSCAHGYTSYTSRCPERCPEAIAQATRTLERWHESWENQNYTLVAWRSFSTEPEPLPPIKRHVRLRKGGPKFRPGFNFASLV